MIQVTGTLLNPLNQPLANTTIRITATNTDEVLVGSVGSVKTDMSGFYNFNMVNGEFFIDVNYNDEFKIQKHVLVDEATEDVMTIAELVSENEIVR